MKKINLMTSPNNFPKRWSVFTITSKRSPMVNFHLNKIDYHNFDYYGAFHKKTSLKHQNSTKTNHHTQYYQIQYNDPVLTLCSRNRICVKTGWTRTWRHHVRCVRASLQRVRHYGCTRKAAQNTDLAFCIRHLERDLNQILDSESWCM